MGFKKIDKLIGYERNCFGEGLTPVYCGFDVVHTSPKVHKKPVRAVFKKAIVSGNIIEIVEYEKPVIEGYNSTGKGKVKSEVQCKRKDNINSAKMKLRRLINANASNSMTFVTLTYSDNMCDIKQGKNDFKNFVKRWNYKRKKDGLEPLKYVYVVEFQKRGAVHFHCVFFNVRYIHNSDLNCLWGKGFVKINKVNHVDNVGAYVVKYMHKSADDNRLNNSDLYGRSRGNLREPEEIKNPQEVAILEGVYKNKCVYQKSYTSDYHGQMTYKQYNIKREVIQELNTECNEV